MTILLRISINAFLITGLLWSCNQPASNKQETPVKAAVELTGVDERFQYITLMGDSVLSPLDPAKAALGKYDSAKSRYLINPDSADLMIWYGRRAAYLGRFQQAIEIYTDGISKHPDDARFYRHRGHRYLTTRKYDLAIIDFEKASQLIKGKTDQIEPDGIPNRLNTPVSTLHSNIWYHLGLAYYLKNDLENALRCYQECAMISTNDDMIVSTAHWYYMTLRKLNDSEAANEVIADISSNMDIIENQSYQRLCLFYKGNLKESDLQHTESGNPSNDAVLYGLGNWFLYNADSVKAKEYYKGILENGNKASFGYLAAEADYLREF